MNNPFANRVFSLIKESRLAREIFNVQVMI